MRGALAMVEDTMTDVLVIWDPREMHTVRERPTIEEM